VSTYGSGGYGLGAFGFGTLDLTRTFTHRLYNGLPQLYRDADDGTLLNYIRLLADQAGEVETLVERISYTPPDERGDPLDTSDLVDPATADSIWLPWLAQLVGVVITPGTDAAGQRDAIANAVNGFRAGTKGAIAAAARTAVTGSQYVAVYDHSISSIGDGGAWDVLVVTKSSETPDSAAVLQAVLDQRAKPAGVQLHHGVYTASWTAVESAYATWTDATGKTWTQIGETGL
jgi:hypothetical protein